MEISKMIGISTLHITPNIVCYLDNVVSDRKESENCPFAVFAKDFPVCRVGYFICVRNEESEEQSFPYECLNRIVRFAQDLGCEWINLDGDAEVCPYLPTYRKEWEAEDG